mgnify:CR=1 FL=1
MIVKDGSITEFEVENLAAKLLGLDVNFVSGSEIQDRFELDTDMKFSDFVECMRILGSNKLNLLLND